MLDRTRRASSLSSRWQRRCFSRRRSLRRGCSRWIPRRSATCQRNEVCRCPWTVVPGPGFSVDDSRPCLLAPSFARSVATSTGEERDWDRLLYVASGWRWRTDDEETRTLATTLKFSAHGRHVSAAQRQRRSQYDSFTQHMVQVEVRHGDAEDRG